MRNDMGKYNEDPINIFRKECTKLGILDSIEEDNWGIIELLTQTFDESSLEGKIKKARSDYAKLRFEKFYRKRFRLVVDRSIKNTELENELDDSISKSVNSLLNEYKEAIFGFNDYPKERRQKVFKEVKLSQDVPEFIGEDMRSYGPYKKGEIISIPLRNAEIFIREKVAES